MMRKRRGFMLVELIVVLILMALLTAFLLPSLTTYIRRADEQRMLARARAALLAAQTLLIERYASDKWSGGEELTSLLRRGPGRAPAAITAEKVLELAELPSEGVADIQAGWDEHAAVTQFVWTEAVGSGTRSAVWNGKSWSVRRGTALEEENLPVLEIRIDFTDIL